MANQYYDNGLPGRGDITTGSSPRPQLPNFAHFVRGAGHPGLAPRHVAQESAFWSLTVAGHGSLPTPPLSTSNKGFEEGGGPPPSWPVDYLPDRLERPHFAVEAQRRASFATPTQVRPEARPVRAYSSTNPDYSYRNFIGRHSQVIHEEEHADYGPEHVYESGARTTKESPEATDEVGGSIWGTTKAGKPRKRLSQACSTCREKKIKCDPGLGTKECSQCLRFNRECRFDTNSRHLHKSSKSRPSTHSPGANNIHPLLDHLSSCRSSMAPSDVPPVADDVHRTSLSSTSADDLLSPAVSNMSDRQINDAPTPSKRQRVSTDMSDRPRKHSYTYSHDQSDGSRHNSDAHIYHLGYSADVDPITANEKLTKHYLDKFMEYVNIPTFEIFPEERMLHWALSETRKTLHDRIVVYAMMALATVHSKDPHRAEHRALFKSIVHSQLSQLENQYNLQLAHALHFLSFAEFADSQIQQGFGIFVRTVGCIAFLQLNIEQDGHKDTTAYGLSPSMYAECRRRTFWAAYVTDIYSALSTGNPRIMHNTDIFLRLPCASQLYEKDTIPQLPVFDQDNVLSGVPSMQDLVKMADMVHLIQIATICSEVQLNAWRCRNAWRVRRQQIQDRSTRQKLETRLSVWADTYNAALQAKGSGTGHSDVYVGSKDSGARAKRFAGLDFLFHYAHMELNRRIYHEPLNNEEMLSYAKTANLHALETLKLTQQLLTHGGSDTRDYYFATRGPLGGYAVHTALDIITAAGSITDILAPQSSIMTLMWGGCELLEHLSAWWGSAHIQHLQAKERIQTVFNLCQTALNEQKTHFYCSEPMSTSGQGLDQEFDMIYGMDRVRYLRGAYGLSTKLKVEDIFVIDTKRREQKLVVS